ncbi:hypothetical protein DAPPUDRAFT_96143 [Daphnia pulex]|uniref:Uncharacterized protein n=1 Tax=Daphnia pulex TaxID=6669 RepID=E9FX19_DAPPU|nr:hypothetical protein DAPPUDRAFT_96143 [Daphnia pulex]|eukprot:EFX87993.1 hypothetical protein DAPPUDRAFT_96143 [Daphnia pulex]
MAAALTPMPYAAPPPSYAPSPYGAQSTYGDSQSAPIPLAPLVVPGALEDPSAGGGGGGGGMKTTFLALPVLFPILFPIVVPAVVAAVVAAVIAAVIAAVVLVVGKGGAGGNGKKDDYETTPYYDDNSYGNDYQDENNYNNDNYNNYNDNIPNNGNKNRKRRQVEKNKNIPSITSSALPSMSIAQVERLTQVVYAALNSQECIQRLLCEIGSFSRSFSDANRTVTKAVEEYVPEKLKDSYNVFAKAEKCEQYKCGSLKVKS